MRGLSLKLLWVDLLVIGFMLAAEAWQSKYLNNAMVIPRSIMALQAVMVWTMIFTFSQRLPSKAAINTALALSRHKTTTWSALSRLTEFSVVLTAIAVGQWFIAIMSGLVVFGSLIARHSAAKYLTFAKIDFEKKSAVVDI